MTQIQYNALPHSRLMRQLARAGPQASEVAGACFWRLLQALAG